MRSQKRPFFEAEDVKNYFQNTGGPQPREGADLERVANDLDFIAQGYLSFFRVGRAPTAGEYQTWVLRLRGPATALLAHFGLQGTVHHLNNDATINAIHALDRGVPVGEGSDLYLRREIAAVIHAPKVPSRAQTLRLGLRCIQFLLQCVELAADAAEEQKGAPRKAPLEEFYLVRESRRLFVETTGYPRKYTIDDVKGTQGGPLVDFVAWVAAHIRDNLHIVQPAPDASLHERLTALCTSHRRIIERIRQVLPKGSS